MAEEEQQPTLPQQSYVPPSLGRSNGGSSGSFKHSRVTSTVAQSFAADLDSMFGLGMGHSSGGLDTLSQTVEEKYETNHRIPNRASQC